MSAGIPADLNGDDTRSSFDFDGTEAPLTRRPERACGQCG